MRMQYATCQGLARRIEKFMAKQHSFDLPAMKAEELNDMVATMVEQLEEVEDLWSEIARTAREHGPDDPRDGTLMKDWVNVVSIKRVVNTTLAAIDQYTCSDTSLGDQDEDLSHELNVSDLTSTDDATEDELDNSEDGSTHRMADGLLADTTKCQACKTSGIQHIPQECPAYNRCCRCCGREGHLGRSCTASSIQDKIATPHDAAPTPNPVANSTPRYPKSHEPQDSEINQTRRATYTEMGQIITFLGTHQISHQGIAVLGGMEASLLTQWMSVLHMADVKDSNATAEDQHLTATLGMAIGHTRRLCARFIKEAKETDTPNRHTVTEPTRTTKLELASIKTWIHDENSQSTDESDPSEGVIAIRKVEHSDVEDEESDVNEENLPAKQPSGGTDETENIDTDTSADGSEAVKNELIKAAMDLPNGDDKTHVKRGCGTKPKIAKGASHSNLSTPKTARKQTLLAAGMLEQFVGEVEKLSQGIGNAIAAWEKNKNVKTGKKTTEKLVMMREDITDKLSDVMNTWDDVESSGEGNKQTRDVLARGVRGAAKNTKRALHQIDEFIQEEHAWASQFDLEQQPAWIEAGRGQQNNIQIKQQQPAPVTALPDQSAYKGRVQAKKERKWPIPGNKSVAPLANRSLDFSCKLDTKPDSRIRRIKMPTVVQISPRPSTGREAFEYDATFDMSRTKSLLSEVVEDHFGLTDIITYPGPVGLQDANGEPIHCSGEVTFNVTIEDKTTSVSAWVTSDIHGGQLILGSGVMEDLGLQLHRIQDTSNPNGHARDTRTVRSPDGSSAVTRSSTIDRHAHATRRGNVEEDDLILPFKHGFHRRVVVGGDGKRSVYYITPDRTASIRSRKEMMHRLQQLPTTGLSINNFTFEDAILHIDDREERYQSVRQADPSRRPAFHNIPQAVYRPTQNENPAPRTFGHQDRTRRENPPGHAWDSTDVPIKIEFEPGPYNTDIHRDWRAPQASRCFSSDETEEEMRPYRKQNVGIQDNVDTNQLARTREVNQQLLRETTRHDIKQEHNDYPTQQRHYQEQPQRRTDPPSTSRSHNTFAPREQPPHYYPPKGAQRGNTNQDFNPG